MKSYIPDYNDDYYIFKLAFNSEMHIEYMRNGYNHLYNNNGQYCLYTYDGYILINKEAENLFNLFSDGDVLSINGQGIVYCLYDESSNDNAIVCTLQCNSNCVMCPCSEYSRRTSGLCSIQELREILRYIPKDTPFLTITGGEPTLLNEDFFRLMLLLQNNFEFTKFLLLTNGRAFGDFSFVKHFVECIPDNIRIGIPIYGYDENTHDSITQTNGSFKQSVIGIHNLLHYNIEVELRIVLTKQTAQYLDMIARYIVKYFHGIACVNFMGLEMLGNAAKNREKVWIPYYEAFKKSKNAIRFLIANGIDVQIYNLPLCCVDEEYWDICAKSISDYKVEFTDECVECDLKEICGGIFNSTRKLLNFRGMPIKR